MIMFNAMLMCSLQHDRRLLL